MDNNVIKKVLNDNRHLASLPQTLSEVMRVVNDENSSAGDLAGVIMKDPSLTARVLRIVNSPFYGVGRQIGTMTQAVMTLGMRQVTALALSSSVYRMTDSWQSSLERTRFWRHSLEVAIAARLIAEEIKYPHAEEAFISGLLHDIGVLILEKSYPAEFARLWKQAHKNGEMMEQEEELWGTNHARVGQFLLQQWHLPDRICEAVGRHHSVFVPGTTTPELILPQIVALAHLISHFGLAANATSNAFDIENKDIMRVNLNIPVEHLTALEVRLFEQTIKEAQFLEIEIGQPEEILSQANQLLFEQYLTVETLLRENRQMQQQIAHDQLARSSWQSLRQATLTFSRYMYEASAIVRDRADQVQKAVESGSIVDPQRIVTDHVHSIIAGVDALRSVIEELTKITATDGVLAHDSSYMANVEQRLKRHLADVEQPVAAR